MRLIFCIDNKVWSVVLKTRFPNLGKEGVDFGENQGSLKYRFTGFKNRKIRFEDFEKKKKKKLWKIWIFEKNDLFLPIKSCFFYLRQNLFHAPPPNHYTRETIVYHTQNHTTSQLTTH